MNVAQSRLIKKWKAASDDLGIEIVAPYAIELQNGRKLNAKLLVKHFGHCNGTLIFTDAEEVWPYRKELAALGYAYSVLEEPVTETNELYDRDIFIDMLSEWEWTGDEKDGPQWILPPPEEEDK
jgi:hypothetical protein